MEPATFLCFSSLALRDAALAVLAAFFDFIPEAPSTGVEPHGIGRLFHVVNK
jgi:hypothetical protein